MVQKCASGVWNVLGLDAGGEKFAGSLGTESIEDVGSVEGIASEQADNARLRWPQPNLPQSEPSTFVDEAQECSRRRKALMASAQVLLAKQSYVKGKTTQNFVLPECEAGHSFPGDIHFSGVGLRRSVDEAFWGTAPARRLALDTTGSKHVQTGAMMYSISAIDTSALSDEKIVTPRLGHAAAASLLARCH